MLKKFGFIVTCLLLLSTLVLADEPNKPSKKVVEGYVFDQITSEPLEGVCIRIENTDSVVYTDESGRFEISVLAQDGLKLSAGLISYQPNVLPLANSESLLIIKLSEQD